jgi:N-methylhydantoinase A
VFHEAHRERYGYAQELSEIEIVSARLRSLGLVEKPVEQKIRATRGGRAPHDEVNVYLDGRKVKAAFYRREELPAGTRVKTPCIVSEYSATTLIAADARARVDEFGNLLIEISPAKAQRRKENP